MTSGFDPRIDSRHAAWCGAALMVLAVLAPVFGWLAPLTFAPLAALAGLIGFKALRLETPSLSWAVPLMVLLAWAVLSILWSPYRPEDLEGWTALKLVLQLVVYWAAVCAAAEAGGRERRRALQVFAWGMAALGAVFLVEALSGALVYRTLRQLIGDPIRPDLAAKNVAQGGFILAVLWAPAAVAAVRSGAPWQLALVMAAGLLASSFAFGSDAPVLALAMALVWGAATLRWPAATPRALAALVVLYFLGAPLAVIAAKATGLYAKIQAVAPLSWSQRMDYWSHAVRWTRDHPLRGWGLDASRSFAPGIKLHPHDAALQVWLELGFVGAVCVAAFWAILLLRLSRRTPDLAIAAGVAAAVSYLTFAAVSFGVWQEWWLATGAIAAAFVVAVERQPPRKAPAPTMGASTSAPISE